MLEKLFLFILITTFLGCASPTVSVQSRQPSSQNCRAECVLEDTGVNPTLARLLAAQLGEVAGPDFLSLKKQCASLAATYIEQHGQELRNISPVVIGPAGFSLQAVFTDQIYSSLEVTVKNNIHYVDFKSPVANALNSCSSN